MSDWENVKITGERFGDASGTFLLGDAAGEKIAEALGPYRGKVQLIYLDPPFFTGQQSRMLDMEGQVDRFYRRLQARQEFLEDKKSREEAKTSTDRLISELDLGKRPTEILAEAGFVKIADVLAKLSESGDAGLLDIHGFGQKSLIDLKKKLRSFGYEVSVSEE